MRTFIYYQLLIHDTLKEFVNGAKKEQTTGPTTTTTTAANEAHSSLSNSSSNSGHSLASAQQPADADASTAAGRRKLRSSGRLGLDELPAVERVQRSVSTNKSPSPVANLNENANSYNNEAESNK
jgi:hypothetical protein